ncbi:phospholipid carrier-dependent glycosyltransferase [Virgisporangium aliadipatigenens]|uniref:Polyprenol-phosphate-mannose--protein mannosyltransferase n=1 Tax=Virgisporangium aliadipatigenens TaxID=741659 RepID=A0A8J3YRD0_9ACTN|nr:phospholipid carrier-dependent glycosyltransferase [Virgisporangium aliadipatigenens]GIJ48456.1 phospholipid carrier-dependent glycosyltransferase [Virgisporangium aliadipatigenens]
MSTEPAVAVIDLSKETQPSPVPPPPPPPGITEEVRQRLAVVGSDAMSWWATGFVVFITALLRLVNLGRPPQIIFDETYYATEGQELLAHGVEWRPESNTGDFVVHPPLGKWLIALGEWAFRDGGQYTAFGWRISAAIAGIISVLIVTRITRRLFRSTVLGCVAGLLIALDGLHFVLSRAALLDIFLTVFVVAAFGCVVMDRDQRRVRVLRALESGAKPGFQIRWWLLLGGLMLGCAASVKQSGAFFVPAIFLIVLIWEIGLRRTISSSAPWLHAARGVAGWLGGFTLIGFVAYIASWAGWFATDTGYNRHWLAAQGKSEPPIIGALINLWEYHKAAYGFHRGLSSHHDYQSWPWQWLLMGRPVAFYWETNQPCGAEKCAAEVLLLGTPILWWSFIPALAGLLWFGIAQRDRRAAGIGIMIAAGLLPWFWYHYDGGRTMFVFYALPAEPFLVMAVVYVLGAIMGPAPLATGDGLGIGRINSNVFFERRGIGALAIGAYVLLVAACFAYFYPIYVGESIPYEDWWARMWLGTRWV